MKSDSLLGHRVEIRTTVEFTGVQHKKLKIRKELQISMVYVISKDGQPLMPMRRHGKVRRLLNSKKAKVVKSCPFTIQLLFETETNVTDLRLGVDTGSGKFSCAVVNPKNEVLYLSEVKVRNDISKKMKRRANYRRNRRNRKLRYRPSRFNNRKNSIKKNRFSPTMKSKLMSHIREIEYIMSILPISQVIIETAKFDTTLLNHKGQAFNRHWGYQKGLNYGFKNAQAATFHRDGYTCQYCKKKNGTLHAHHIIYRSNGGKDTMDNLITLCESCHKKLHNGELAEFESKLKGKRKGTLKHATQMNSIRIQLLKHYPNAIETFGFVTKTNREACGLSKTHYNDAIVIATGSTNPPILRTDNIFRKNHIAKGEYRLYLGVRSEKKRPKGKVRGFLTKDTVKYRNKIYFIKGIISKPEYCVLMNIDEVTQKFENPKTVKLNTLKRISARRTELCISQKII